MNIKKFTKLASILTLTSTLLFLPASQLKASADFTINSNTTVNYTYPQTYIKYTEKVSVEINNNSYYLPSGSNQTFVIQDYFEKDTQEETLFKKASISLTDNYDNTLDYTVEQENTDLIVTTQQAKVLYPGSKYIFTLTYKTHELLNLNGNIHNIYVPGLPLNLNKADRSANGLTTEYTYNTALKIDGNPPEISYLQPEKSLNPVKNENNGTITLDIPTQVRQGNMIWLQLGTEQYYQFKIVQNAPKTDNITPKEISNVTDLISTNIYTLPLPKEHAETKQKVFITNISPEPKDIKRDDQGNLTAIFEVPANQSTEIVAEGYITLSNELKNVKDESLSEYFKTISEDSQIDLTLYTQPDKYWESDSSVIQETANSLKNESNSILELIHNDYDFVIDHLTYSEDKLNNQSNVRAGALQAYNGAQAVCMEYSDLAIALLRAQGIPARAAVGYGNDPSGLENSLNNSNLVRQELGHQWVQVWLPEYGWYSIDPTWGEHDRTYLGANLDHLLWLTMASSKDEDLHGTALLTADVTNNSFTVYDVYLKPLSKEVFEEKFNQETDVELANYLDRFNDVEYNDISYFIKGTLIGRAIVVILPILILITAIFTITVTIKRITKRKRKRNTKTKTKVV